MILPFFCHVWPLVGLLLLDLPAVAHLQASKWFFGANAAVWFNTCENVPVADNNLMVASEGWLWLKVWSKS